MIQKEPQLQVDGLMNGNSDDMQKRTNRRPTNNRQNNLAPDRPTNKKTNQPKEQLSNNHHLPTTNAPVGKRGVAACKKIINFGGFVRYLLVWRKSSRTRFEFWYLRISSCRHEGLCKGLITTMNIHQPLIILGFIESVSVQES